MFITGVAEYEDIAEVNMYESILVRFENMVHWKRWKAEGAFARPNGITTNSNCPKRHLNEIFWMSESLIEAG